MYLNNPVKCGTQASPKKLNGSKRVQKVADRLIMGQDTPHEQSLNILKLRGHVRMSYRNIIA